MESAVEILTDLSDELSNVNKEMERTALLLLGRHSSLKRKIQRGTIKSEEIQIEESKILEAILDFVLDID